MKATVAGLPQRVADPPDPQEFLNGEVHGWYRIIHGYSDHLVSGLIDEFGLKPGDRVLDPFCGTGTTLVECMKRGIESVGIDANPSSCFAATVKTRWNLSPERILTAGSSLRKLYRRFSRNTLAYQDDPTFIYLDEAGLVDRGWISDEPLRKIIAVKASIGALRAPWPYKQAAMLALMAESLDAANVKFGPELYCSDVKEDADVLGGVLRRLQVMASDLRVTGHVEVASSSVFLGDSRNCSALLRRSGSFSAVICSPPYPNEHDYTRNSRLELALLEAVTCQTTLQTIKRRMIRSHTKGIYVDDADGQLVDRLPAVRRIAATLERKVKPYRHGFARYYPAVIREYFGGMRRHLISVRRVLRKGAPCAYVVGDQACYLGTFVPTAAILARIARRVGYSVIEIRKWRGRRPTTGRRAIAENVLLLRRSEG